MTTFTGADLTAQDSAGNAVAGVQMTIYSAMTGGVVVTSITTMAGAALPGYATSDSTGRWQFKDTNNADLLWGQVPGATTRWPLRSVESTPAAGAASVSASSAQTAAAAAMSSATTANTNATTALTKANQAYSLVMGTPIVNVKAYGAVGDGTTDDAAAFDAASASGLNIYVPPGTYKHTAADSAMSNGRFYGPGVIFATGSGYGAGETIALDMSTPQRINSIFVGGGHRNDTRVGQGAGIAMGNDSGANTVLGWKAMTTTTKAQRNVAVGSGAAQFLGDANRSGVVQPNNNALKNTWVGADAGYASIWADSNTFVGSNAGKWCGDPNPITSQHDFFNGNPGYTLANIDDANRWPSARTDLVGAAGTPSNVAQNENHNTENVGVGRNTLLHAVRANDCVAIGYNALAHGYNVSYSVAVGQGALRDGLEANHCVAVGNTALFFNASGIGNVAVGSAALSTNTHSQYNVAIGFEALKLYTGNTGGVVPTGRIPSGPRRNTAVGPQAMSAATGGSWCVGIGSTALNNNQGDNNVAVGTAALGANTTGTDNTAVGTNAMSTSAVISGTAVGSAATVSGNSGTAVGRSAAAAQNAISIGSGSAASGAASVVLGTNGAASGTNAVAIGPNSIANVGGGVVIGSAATVSTTGTNSVAVGLSAAAVGVSGVAVGTSASAPTANSTAVGAGAIAGTTTGPKTNATAVGNAANSVFTNSAAFGNGATTIADNQIQLGNGSIASFRCQVALTVVSDARDKTNVKSTKLGLGFIEQLRPVDFTYHPRGGKLDHTPRHGFIAQEVLEAAEAESVTFGGVDTTDPEHLGLSETSLIPALVRAIQELSARVRELEAA